MCLADSYLFKDYSGVCLLRFLLKIQIMLCPLIRELVFPQNFQD